MNFITIKSKANRIDEVAEYFGESAAQIIEKETPTIQAGEIHPAKVERARGWLRQWNGCEVPNKKLNY